MIVDLFSIVGSAASIASEIRTIITKYKENKDEKLLLTMRANIDYSKVPSDLCYQLGIVDKYIESKKDIYGLGAGIIISKEERTAFKDDFYRTNSDIIVYKDYIDPVIDGYLDRVNELLNERLTIGERVIGAKIDKLQLSQNDKLSEIERGIKILLSSIKTPAKDIQELPETSDIALKKSFEAWGPQSRETYKWEALARVPIFNSITDNPSLGDERNFVRVREYKRDEVKDNYFVDYVDGGSGLQ